MSLSEDQGIWCWQKAYIWVLATSLASWITCAFRLVYLLFTPTSFSISLLFSVLWGFSLWTFPHWNAPSPPYHLLYSWKGSNTNRCASFQIHRAPHTWSTGRRGIGTGWWGGRTDTAACWTECTPVRARTSGDLSGPVDISLHSHSEKSPLLFWLFLCPLRGQSSF